MTHPSGGDSGRAQSLIGRLFALALAAACGGGDRQAQPAADAAADAPSAAAAASFDPCALVTADEVEAAVGWKPAAVEPYPQPNGTGHCKYTGAGGMTGGVPEQLDVGIGVCPTNMPCTELPEFASSAELAAYRRKGYEGANAGLDPTIEPVEGLGVPAIRHELAGLLAVEMAIGGKRLAYVETWAPFEAARGLAEKVLARAR